MSDAQRTTAGATTGRGGNRLVGYTREQRLGRDARLLVAHTGPPAANVQVLGPVRPPARLHNAAQHQGHPLIETAKIYAKRNTERLDKSVGTW